jgi:hypothetical protein
MRAGINEAKKKKKYSTIWKEAYPTEVTAVVKGQKGEGGGGAYSCRGAEKARKYP